MNRPVHGYAGAAWLQRQRDNAPISPLGEVVADILGFVFGGLYHLPFSIVEKPAWGNSHSVQVTVPDGLATHDGGQLTYLVLLAHACCVRVQVNGGGPRGLKLSFSARDRSSDGMSNHPTIEQAIARFGERVSVAPDGSEVSA